MEKPFRLLLRDNGGRIIYFSLDSIFNFEKEANVLHSNSKTEYERKVSKPPYEPVVCVHIWNCKCVCLMLDFGYCTETSVSTANSTHI